MSEETFNSLIQKTWFNIVMSVEALVYSLNLATHKSIINQKNKNRM